MSNLQDAINRVDQEVRLWDTKPGSHQDPFASNLKALVEAARRVASGIEIRYCLWHERRAADDSGDEDSGVIVTRFCSSQDGSHDCVVETRLLIGIITEDAK